MPASAGAALAGDAQGAQTPRGPPLADLLDDEGPRRGGRYESPEPSRHSPYYDSPVPSRLLDDASPPGAPDRREGPCPGCHGPFDKETNGFCAGCNLNSEMVVCRGCGWAAALDYAGLCALCGQNPGAMAAAQQAMIEGALLRVPDGVGFGGAITFAEGPPALPLGPWVLCAEDVAFLQPSAEMQAAMAPVAGGVQLAGNGPPGLAEIWNPRYEVLGAVQRNGLAAPPGVTYAYC